MIIFLDETKFTNCDSNFNIIVENHFLESLFLENVDFIDTKFTKNSKGDYQIVKSSNEQRISSLKLKEINNNNDIYEITWRNKKTLMEDFTTYCYIEDYEKFMIDKKVYEKDLNINFSNIIRATPKDIEIHQFNSFEQAGLDIISFQKNVKAPNFLYYLFEEVISKPHSRTLRHISFV